CLIYLGYFQPDGEESALLHARRMLDRFPEDGREFMYVIVWASRRLRRYDEAYQCASEGIQRFRDDPRFWHGQSLTMFSWFRDPTHRDSWRFAGLDAIAHLQKAAELYARNGEQNRVLLGAAHCNVAYFSCIEDPAWNAYDVERAVADLNWLKHYVPPDQWYPAYPEYFHAEAMVTYHVFRRDRDANVSGKRLLAELDCAEKSNEAALELFTKQSFLMLREQIAAARVEVLSRQTET
ncbi:MAG: hypothetical protein AAB393_12035, partial [Bacteroidota bacterium]